MKNIRDITILIFAVKGMSKNMITAIDWYGSMENDWFKNFKNLYNQ